jgi:hypothetical protein
MVVGCSGSYSKKHPQAVAVSRICSGVLASLMRVVGEI